jgi:hypothetical protein
MVIVRVDGKVDLYRSIERSGGKIPYEEYISVRSEEMKGFGGTVEEYVRYMGGKLSLDEDGLTLKISEEEREVRRKAFELLRAASAHWPSDKIIGKKVKKRPN